MSNEPITPKTYDHVSNRVLNRTIKKREEQIALAEAGKPTSKKTLGQLRHELDAMQNALLERAILNKVEAIKHNSSETTTPQEKKEE